MWKTTQTIALLFPVILVACDATDPGSEVDTYVVEAILEAGEPLPDVRLTRAAPLGETYNSGRLGIAGAIVTLRLLTNAAETVYTYAGAPGSRGVYLPRDPDAITQPLGTYQLDIATERGTITGQTTVPDTFRVLRGSLETGVYQGEEQLEITHSPSRSPNRLRSYVIITTEALDPTEENLTPLAKDILEQSVGDATIESLRVSGSPILNEDNIVENADGSFTFRYPWIGINFYGRNRIGINALDDNAYDFLRSQSVQQGGSTFAPGEIPNPLESLQGGHGLFGSIARASYDFVVTAAPATTRASSP